MNDPVIETDRQVSELVSFTVNTVNVGTKLYETLVQHAKNCPGRPIYYSDLLDAARAAHPLDTDMQQAVPIGIGPKLLFVQAFCSKNGYPNLACLAVNRATGRPGPSFQGNWELEMQKVAQFDWTIAKPHLETFATAMRELAAPRKRVKESDARTIVWEHYRQNKTMYPRFSEEEKEEIIKLVMDGVSVDIAFKQIRDQ